MDIQATKLLIVEDNTSLRLMLSWDFEERGYHVITARNCSEAETALNQSNIDIALVDQDLPDGCGNDLLPLIHHCFPGMPIILCSGRIRERESSPDAYAFVAKPMNCTSLHHLFQQALSKF